VRGVYEIPKLFEEYASYHVKEWEGGFAGESQLFEGCGGYLARCFRPTFGSASVEDFGVCVEDREVWDNLFAKYNVRLAFFHSTQRACRVVTSEA
jgi:hypothetical protein